MATTNFQGRYLSDVFLIEFPPHVRIFSRDNSHGPKSPADFGTFVHEYWHYLLNISTSRGFQDFALWQQLIPVFTQTLIENGDGTSSGSDSRSSFYSHMEDVERILFNYMGTGFGLGLDGSPIVDVQVTGEAEFRDAGLSLQGQRIFNRIVSIPVRVQTSLKAVDTYYVLGNQAINESIANAVERMVFDDGTIPPIHPYLILDRIAEFYNNGQPLSRYEIAALGTLSYLSTDAAPSFIGLLKQYINLRRRFSIEQSLMTIKREFLPRIQPNWRILIEDARSIQSIYNNRGALSTAISIIVDKFETYINMRSQDLLFDLGPFDSETGHCDLKKLEELIFKIVPSCDIRQVLDSDEGEDAINKDLIRSFDIQPIILNGHTVYSSYLMQVFQCAFQFFRAHWTLSGTFIRSEAATDRCPYYTTCNLPLRVKSANVCREKPWQSMNAEENCMYGSGVAALLGQVKIKQHPNATITNVL